MKVMALRPQLMAIAHHGWRLQVDTRWLSDMLYLRQPQDLSIEQANELLMFLAKQAGPEDLGAAIYDWQESEEEWTDDELG